MDHWGKAINSFSMKMYKLAHTQTFANNFRVCTNNSPSTSLPAGIDHYHDYNLCP
jgi:hypothetical protein